jgi:hypothetical protein
MKKVSEKPKKNRLLTAEQFDAKADSGEDIMEHLDLSQARIISDRKERRDVTSTKVNVDFPRWMVQELDRESDLVGVPRQSLIKMWLAERLQKA